jgi:hypothetical protein
VEGYEGLRRRAVQLDGSAEYSEGRAILMRRGLAAWAQLHPSIALARPPDLHSQSASPAPILTSPGAELIRLVASLILSTRREDLLHA